MQNNKRGISPVISWILIIGFTMTLAGFSMTWMRETASTTSEKMVDNIGTDLECGDVSINAYNTSGSCAKINITNKGFFTITGVKFRSGKGLSNITQTIIPTTEIEISTGVTNFLPNNELGIIPEISYKDKTLVCINKEIRIKC
ncbi:hypothetical protein HN992_03225 [Candidatus Woesearchaeota archaeon]|jgi:flagellin-like protein|nr:hypothetical protein [Candidatus Woesearchaeota archaeon]MBT3438931.1 hypothetical protein [Candidatus Woesearchaeota archaeon]MBT4058183.1 hypothetical protein [Candidatus Woesearchaeota archaeon]MBT4206852.1 hypothetical protein [Candidatus Woesearchaeota archaeon]MBT4731026.1 hypothetical protein [Candidatus Woesearchaeota archaeon]